MTRDELERRVEAVWQAQEGTECKEQEIELLLDFAVTLHNDTLEEAGVEASWKAHSGRVIALYHDGQADDAALEIRNHIRSLKIEVES